MIIKILLLVCLALMVFNLFKALFIMNKPSDKRDSNMSTFIGRRLLFSITMVLLILIGIATGVITPNPHPYDS